MGILLALGALGCGRLGFEQLPPDGGRIDGGSDAGARDAGMDAGVDGGRDAAVDAGPPPDAGPPTWEARPLCGFGTGAWTLTEPAPVTELNEAGATDLEPQLTADGLTMYLASDRGGRFAVYVSTRPDTSAPFSTPVPVDGLGAGDRNVYHFAPTSDGLGGLAAAAGVPGGTGRADIWIVERATTSDPFAFVSPAGTFNTAENEHDPWLSPDDLRVYFLSEGLPDGLGGQDLYMASRPAPGAAFDAVVHLTELDTVDDEDNPALTSDELHIVFGSDRPGGTGDKDLWIASRTSRTEPFGPAANLAPLNTAGRDAESHISPDGCELYLTREVAGGGVDIFRSRVIAR